MSYQKGLKRCQIREKALFYGRDASPVIHADENDWLTKIDRSRDDATAIVSVGPNLKTALKQGKKETNEEDAPISKPPP